ncbi:SRPBCC family protein [Streptomyces sp. E2N171]|uniref:SRPBCC family protein n=1 Tax=Streptomyces sp. E2N171 TaxID=1851914 RepID=UPI000EF570B1|nr:SRPBCC family protein [Streptomyces sp. E2N171]
MATFELQRTVSLPPAEAWRRVTTWPRHGEVVPLTRITVTTPPPTGEGTLFVARTGAGPLGFDDPMEVTAWRPPAGDSPGFCRLEKHGRTVLGWAEIEVHARPGGRCRVVWRGGGGGGGEVGVPARPGGRGRVVWREDARVRFLPAACDGLLARAGRVMFGRATDRLLRRG